MALEPTIIDEWIAEREQRGREKGAEEEAQRFTLRVLTRRFGPLPEEWEGRVRRADVAWCENLVDQALQVESLSELDSNAE